MARARVDFREFKKFRDKFQKAIDQNEVEQLIRECLFDLAKKMLRKVKNRTPFNTGLLRNSWTIGSITKNGDLYEIEVYTDIEYAPFVEKGFRAHFVPGYWSGNQFVYDPSASTGMQVGKPGRWVQGKFMMHISEQEIEREMSKFMKRKQEQFLKRILGGG